MGLSSLELCQFTEGAAVVIGHLVVKPELNGKTGTVLSYAAQLEQVAVKLNSSDSVRVRPSNLRPSIFATIFSPG